MQVLGNTNGDHHYQTITMNFVHYSVTMLHYLPMLEFQAFYHLFHMFLQRKNQNIILLNINK